MKVAILDVRRGTGRVASKSYTVAYRNLCVLRDYFKADLFVNASEISPCNDYDIIICGFGSTSCEKELSTEFLKRNKGARVFWLVGEYEQSTFAPLFYSGRQFEIIKNFEHTMKNKKCIAQHFLNINSLLAKNQNPISQKKHGCLYYGRWRDDRLLYFEEYLQKPLMLSTGSKNIKQFTARGCKPSLISPLSWAAGRESLNLFRSSLYIEDVFTHTHYNCLANRFYEAIFCNVLPLFDKSCLNTLEKSGLSGWDWFVVDGLKDLVEKTNSENIAVVATVKRWAKEAMDERASVLASIERLFSA